MSKLIHFALLFASTLLIKNLFPQYFPLDSSALLEYHEVKYSVCKTCPEIKSFSTITRSISALNIMGDSSNQIITDSIFRIDSVKSSLSASEYNIDSTIESKTFKISYSNSHVTFDSIFPEGSFQQLNMSVFDIPGIDSNYKIQDLQIINNCTFLSQNVVENCIGVNKHYDYSSPYSRSSKVIFSEKYGIKEYDDHSSAMYGIQYIELRLKKIFYKNKVILIEDEANLKINDANNKVIFIESLNSKFKMRPIEVTIYSISGKKLISKMLTEGEKIGLNGLSKNLVYLIKINLKLKSEVFKIVKL